MLPATAVIFPAAGLSSRFGGKTKKPFADLDGRPLWVRTVEQFVTRDEVKQLLIVVAPDEVENFKSRFGANIMFFDLEVVEGGTERSESVYNALQKVRGEIELVAVHDAVRPFLTAALIDAVFRAAAETGAALPAVEVADTLKRATADGLVAETVSRKDLFQAQTPQVFRRTLLLDAYARRGGIAGPITDDCQIVEHFGHPVTLVPGLRTNIKITTKDDLALAELILKNRVEKVRPRRPFEDDDMYR